ncbi:hypothetical protein MANES_16G132900v8 [Manihot esculenta]|uniref:Peptidase A1 domain-containing protein n=2 Tax=Manihot esculenta TaxID=3983 RepID=A0A2C9UCD2_MANES|nr:hypothetical protein MANES_16G132900v8 [Manihot esculenta]
MPTTHFSSISLITYAFLLMIMFPCCSLQKSFDTHNAKVSSFLPPDVCDQSSQVHHNIDSSLELVHKLGPCFARFHDDKNKKLEKSGSYNIQEMLIKDQARVHSIHAKYSRYQEQWSSAFKEKQTTVPIHSGINIGTGNYVVMVALGTPAKNLTLVFDTGSDITWTQCEPCVRSCYRQAQPKFDPRKSSSYKNVSCSSASCQLIRASGGAKGCSSSTCLYGVQYGDGSYSVGFFAIDKLTISSDVFNNFLFGCGQENKGLFGKSAGLLGLGRKRLSLAFQTARKYKKLFSYCLPSLSSTGHLSFGGKLPKSVKFTPLSSKLLSTPFYGIDVTGISVGGHKLSANASVFSKADTIIDSGTVITRLQPTVYSELSSTFQEFMKDYPLTDGVSILDTCYDFSNYDEVLVPKISIFLRGGVEIEVNNMGIMVAIKGPEQVCLAFASTGDDTDLTILGSTQQKSYEVVHDLAKGRIGFAPGGCS